MLSKKPETVLKHWIQSLKEKRQLKVTFDKLLLHTNKYLDKTIEELLPLLNKIEGVTVDRNLKLINIKTKRQLTNVVKRNSVPTKSGQLSNGNIVKARSRKSKNKIQKGKQLMEDVKTSISQFVEKDCDRNNGLIAKQAIKMIKIFIEDEEKFNSYNILKCLDKRRCDFCQVVFKNNSDLVKHELDQVHILREKYRTDRKFFLNQLTNAKVRCKSNSVKEELIVNQIHSVFNVYVTNRSFEKYKLTMLELVPNSQVTIKNTINEIKGCQTIAFEVIVNCSSPGLILYPMLIVLYNDSEQQILDLTLKELIFRHKSDVEELLPLPAYKPANQLSLPEQEQIVIVNAPVVQMNPDNLVIRRNLKGYDMPRTLMKIFNAGLMEKKLEMTPPLRNKFRDIRRLLNTPLNNTNLSASILRESCYYEIFRLLLFMEEYQEMKDIRQYNRQNQILKTVQGIGYLLELQLEGLSEQRPSVLRNDRVIVIPESKENSSFKYEGIIHEVRSESIRIALDRNFFNRCSLSDKYSIEFNISRECYRKQHRAAEYVQQHKVTRFFFPKLGILPKLTVELPRLEFFNKMVENNEEQKQAVINIVTGTSYPVPFLLFGPPGTGKTSTLVEAIKQIWKTKPNSHILVCAPSNSAANVITERLLDDVKSPKDLIRLLAVSQDWNTLSPKIQPFTNYDHKYQEMNFPELNVLKKYRIIIITLMSAAKLVGACFPVEHFSHVFIDECGQATETETLIPIVGVLTSEQKIGKIHGQVILAGDPKQLGPIIHSPYAKRYGFGISLLERLMTTVPLYQRDPRSNTYNARVLTKLVKNFRSNKHILHISNEKFYHGELIACADKRSKDAALYWKQLHNKQFPVLFHCSYGCQERESSSPSYYNQEECKLVMDYVKLIVNKVLNPFLNVVVTQKDIGIISPYKLQVRKLKQRCEGRGYHDITVGSVEQFQGEEKLVIIITTVRSTNIKSKQSSTSNSNQILGFLTNPKRFNVALTRAKSLLIVIGNPHVLYHDENWRDLIKHCNENQALLQANEFLKSLKENH